MHTGSSLVGIQNASNSLRIAIQPDSDVEEVKALLGEFQKFSYILLNFSKYIMELMMPRTHCAKKK